MENIFEWRSKLHTEGFKRIVTQLYDDTDDTLNQMITRYEELLTKFERKFDGNNLELFSTPGRTEISGNHTDHNHGRVLAASVNLDSIACVQKTENGIITIHSKGFDEDFVVDTNDLEPKHNEQGKTNSLIRGVTAKIKGLGFRIGGFNAYLDSNVLVGSGLSSSASIEVLLGTIINHLFNKGKISNIELALIGQYAENHYFGKPCGLMDQIACAVGGIVAIDFENPMTPRVEDISFEFRETGYSMVVVNTGGNHADLTDDYAAIPEEMRKIASFFSASVCREITLEQIMNNVGKLREQFGDRAVMRALHFIHENKRVVHQLEALKENNFDLFLKYVQDSGNSSFKYLQNCFTTQNVSEQGISLALAITEDFLNELGGGACRVHGGGFAGTIQVLLPKNSVDNYLRLVNSVFGNNAGIRLSIRNVGSTKIEL